jgi:hypothetical protein
MVIPNLRFRGLFAASKADITPKHMSETREILELVNVEDAI